MREAIVKSDPVPFVYYLLPPQFTSRPLHTYNRNEGAVNHARQGGGGWVVRRATWAGQANKIGLQTTSLDGRRH